MTARPAHPLPLARRSQRTHKLDVFRLDVPHAYRRSGKALCSAVVVTAQ
jgi:hypothetical protein